jgi:hypothetical protein
MDLHSYDLSASGRDQAGDFALELGVPVELGSSSSARGRQLRLEPGYRRSLSLLTRETTVGDVSADFSTAGSAFESQRYAYTGIPFWELYDARLAARFLADSASVETASYQAESFLRVSRTFSSRLQDLLLPSYFEAAVDRALERDGDLTRVANYYKLQSRWRAINLFGRFGAYPHFPWYRTDEFSGDLAVSLGTENGVLEIDELRLEHALSLENGELGSLSLENRLRITLIDALEWSDGVFLSLDWYRYPEGGISLPLLPPRIKEGSFWSHRESLACKLAGPAAGVEATSYHPLNLTVSHQTAVNLPERGLVSARVGLGLDLERTSDGSSYWRFAIEGAIEARLEF